MSKYLDIHILQTVPPSCVNRDDTGSPKTAVYGGVVRARVSSQAWKHSVRAAFSEMLTPDLIGYRTKKIVPMVMNEIQTLAIEKGVEIENVEKAARAVLTAAGLKLKEDSNIGTDAMFFMSCGQARALAQLVVETPEKAADKKAAQAALKTAPSVDLALFGRMVADDPSLSYDAACQVAHSISTHEVHNEYDYFTAVDDMSDEDSAGAGHIGTNEFASSTLYRYATVNLNELSGYLGDDTTKAVIAFVKAFVRSMPTGKQNTFANRTLPDMVYVTLRDDQPVNLVGAFERAVRSNGEGYVEPSKKRLAEYAETIYETYTGAPVQAYVIGGAVKGAEAVNEKVLMEKLEKTVAEVLTGGVS